MAVAFDEVKAAAVKALRSFATRYGDSALEYGKVLQDFGAGTADPGDVVKTGVNLTVREVNGAINDGSEFGKAYLQWSYSLLGLSVPKKQDDAPPEVAPAAPAADAKKDMAPAGVARPAPAGAAKKDKPLAGVAPPAPARGAGA